MTIAAPRTVLCMRDVEWASDDPDDASLTGVSAKVDQGQLVVLTGPQMSGTREALRVAGLREAPTSGTVQFDGEDVSRADAYSRAELRSAAIGYLSQEPRVARHMTAVENVILPMAARGVERSTCLEAATDALRAAGFDSDKRDAATGALPALDRHRVALARALASDPALLVACEPTGSLTPEDGASLIRLIQAAANDRVLAVLCASHDVKMLRAADEITWMDNGRVIHTGSADDAPPWITGRRAFRYRHPDNLCRGLALSGRYAPEATRALHDAADRLEQAVELATVFNGEPGDAASELLDRQLSRLRESAAKLGDATRHIESVASDHAAQPPNPQP